MEREILHQCTNTISIEQHINVQLVCGHWRDFTQSTACTHTHTYAHTVFTWVLLLCTKRCKQAARSHTLTRDTSKHTVHLADLDSTYPEGAVKGVAHTHTHTHTAVCEWGSWEDSRVACCWAACQIEQTRGEGELWCALYWLFTAAFSRYFPHIIKNISASWSAALHRGPSLSLLICVFVCLFMRFPVAWQHLIFVNMFVFCRRGSPQSPADHFHIKHHGS